MKRIQYNEYGGPERMRLDHFEPAAPGNGEVEVEVKFAAINPIDWKLRNGNLKMVTGRQFPRGMGQDFSGKVVAVGPGVTRFKPGDAVFGLASIKGSGAFGQVVIAPEGFLARKPDNLSFEDAACLGTPGVTAWNGLVDKAALTAGQHVFINGCTGAVGAMAVQLARMTGARISGACSAGAMAGARSLGVQTVYDYRVTDLAQLKERYDVVYDTSATMATATGMRMLAKGGVFLDIDPTPGKFFRALFDRRLKPIVCSPAAPILDGLAQAAQEGKVRLPIARTVPLNDAIPLITALEAGLRLDGKALIAMG